MDGFEDVASGEVDGAGLEPGEFDLGAVGGDEGVDDIGDAAAGEVVGFKICGGDLDAGFDAFDTAQDDDAGIDLGEALPVEAREGHAGPREERLPPVGELGEYKEENQADERDDDEQADDEGVHLSGILTGRDVRASQYPARRFASHRLRSFGGRVPSWRLGRPG